MSNDVYMKVNGQKLSGWTDVSIKRSVESVAGTFKFSVVDIWQGDAIYLEPQMLVDIFIDEDQLMQGYIDERSIDAGPDSNSISLSGRCRTADLVDCSVTETPGSWKDIAPLTMISNICSPFDIHVSSETDLGEKLKVFTINAGESAFEAISKILENRAVLPISDERGNLLLTNAGSNVAHDKLVYGFNVISAQLNQDYKERFAVVRVKGQQSGKGKSWNKGLTGIIGEAQDGNIERWRPKVIVPGSQITPEGAIKRAAWEAQVRAGRSSTVQLNVSDWRQSNGDLWRENLSVYIDIPKLGVDGMMVIKDIEYNVNSTGRSLSMGLALPEIYAPEPKEKIKKKKSKSKAKRNEVIWR